MLDYIQCPSCGNNIGALYEAFKSIKVALYKKELEKNKSRIGVQNINMIDYIQIPMDKYFDQFNIKNDCCRSRLTTCVNFNDGQYLLN